MLSNSKFVLDGLKWFPVPLAVVSLLIPFLLIQHGALILLGKLEF